MRFIEIHDSCITGFQNSPPGILWKDKTGGKHVIDLESCAMNFLKSHKYASKNCVGEREMDGKWFILYTDDIKTKIAFAGYCVFRGPLKGTKAARFRALQNQILRLMCKTYDLS